MKIFKVLILFFCTSTPLFSQLTIDLNTAIDLALTNSAELRQSSLQIQTEKAAAQLELRQWLPQVNFAYSDNFSRVQGGPDPNQIEWAVKGSQLLYDGGQGYVKSRLSGLAIQEGERNWLLSRDQVVDQIFEIFHSLLLLEEKAALLRKLVSLSDVQKQVTDKEYQLGLITEIDLLETQLEFQGLQINLKQTESQLEQTYFSFKDALGMEIETSFHVTGVIPSQYEGLALTASQQELLSLAVVNNSQVKALSAQIEGLKIQKALYDFNFLPIISLQGEAALKGEQYPLDTWDYSLTLSVQVPLSVLPISTSISIGTAPPLSERKSTTTSVSPLPSLDFIKEGLSFNSQFTSLAIQYDKTLLALQGQIASVTVQHRLLKESLVLQKEKKLILDRRLFIMEKQLELGGLKRIDFIKAQVSQIEQEVAIRESIIQLMIVERQIESLLGLPVGELTKRYVP